MPLPSCWQLAAVGVTPPEPFTTPAMHAAATRQVATEGAAAMRHQPLSGTPYKVYAIAAGRAHIDPLAFAAWSLATRGLRIVVVGLAVTDVARLCRRLRRFYTPYLLGLGARLRSRARVRRHIMELRGKPRSKSPRSPASTVLTILGLVFSVCLSLVVVGYIALWVLFSQMGPMG